VYFARVGLWCLAAAVKHSLEKNSRLSSGNSRHFMPSEASAILLTKTLCTANLAPKLPPRRCLYQHLHIEIARPCMPGSSAAAQVGRCDQPPSPF
jgi:hypothetical protein